MYVMGRAPACFPGFLLNGSEEGHCAMEGEFSCVAPPGGAGCCSRKPLVCGLRLSGTLAQLRLTVQLFNRFSPLW